MSLLRRRFLGLLAIACCAPMLTARAQVHEFMETTGDWNVGSNWTHGVPGSSHQFATVSENRTAQITGTLDYPEIWQLNVGEGDGSAHVTGTVEQSAGELTTGMDIGDGQDVTGTYDISGGILNSDHIFIGNGVSGSSGLPTAHGNLNVSGSADVNTDWLTIGAEDNGYGVVTQTGGTMTSEEGIRLHNGAFNISGGSYAHAGGNDIRMYHGEIAVSGTADVDFAPSPWDTSIMMLHSDSRISVTGDQASLDIAGRLSVGCGWDGSMPFGFGTMVFNSASGVSPIGVGLGLYLNDGTGGSGMSVLEVDLETAPPLAGDVLLFDIDDVLSGKFRDINGTLLDEGVVVPGSGGRTISYVYDAATSTRGAGNDIVLLSGGSVTSPADFDEDGDVDTADFDAWQTGFGTPSGATLAQGDADTDGDVDGADYLVWQRQFDSPGGIAATAIPEPTALILLVVGAMGLYVYRHHE